MGTLLAPAAPELRFDATGSACVLAYAVELAYAAPETLTDGSDGTTLAPLRRGRRVVLDAHSGSVISAVDTARSQYAGAGTKAAGAGVGVLGDTKSFTVLAGPSSPPTFYLQNTPQGATQPQDPPLLFVRRPGLSIVQSPDATAWETTAPEPGVAVDAFAHFGAVQAWWKLHGRNSYDDGGSALAVVVHDDTLAQAAWWQPADASFHVGLPKFDTLNGVQLKSAAAAVDAMGHEFQHAVNASMFITSDSLESQTLDESLGDVFGQFIQASVSEPGVPQDLTALGEALTPKGIRDLGDPHTTHQPDHVADTTFPLSATDAHRNTGVLNRAWTLTAFGGTNATSGVTVPSSLALGLEGSIDLYFSLVTTPAIDSLGSKEQLARALVKLAGSKFGDEPDGPKAAVACAWYAVGVLSRADLKGWNIDLCLDPDGGTPVVGGGQSSPYCQLLPLADVAAAVGVPSLPPPTVTANSELVRCVYSDPASTTGVPALELLIDIDASTVPLSFDKIREQLVAKGFTVQDELGLGLEAFSAVSALVPGGGDVTSNNVVVRTDQVWFQLASRSPVAGELKLAQTMLSHL